MIDKSGSLWYKTVILNGVGNGEAGTRRRGQQTSGPHLASQKPPRAGSALAPAKGRRRNVVKRKAPAKQEMMGAKPTTPAHEIVEVAARAAEPDITPQRVLEEYAHIALADVTHIVSWDASGRLTVRPLEELSPDDRAAIAEISTAGTSGGELRVKLYDKKAALDALAKHFGLFPLTPRRREEEAEPDPEEDPFEELERRLARLAAQLAEDAAAAGNDAEGSADPKE
jgi:hypothetical protein